MRTLPAGRSFGFVAGQAAGQSAGSVSAAGCPASPFSNSSHSGIINYKQTSLKPGKLQGWTKDLMVNCWSFCLEKQHVLQIQFSGFLDIVEFIITVPPWRNPEVRLESHRNDMGYGARTCGRWACLCKGWLRWAGCAHPLLRMTCVCEYVIIKWPYTGFNYSLPEGLAQLS